MKKRTLSLDKEVLTMSNTSTPDGGYSSGNPLLQFACDSVVNLVMEIGKDLAKHYSAGAKDCTGTQACPSAASNCATCTDCWSTYGAGDEIAPACG